MDDIFLSLVANEIKSKVTNSRRVSDLCNVFFFVKETMNENEGRVASRSWDNARRSRDD